MRVAFLMSLLLVSLFMFAPTAAASDARSAPVAAAASAAEAAVDPADEEALLRELGQLDRFVRGRLHMARRLAETGRLAEQAPRLRRDADRVLAALRHVRGEAEWLEEDRRDAIARKIRALRLQTGNLTRALDDDGAAQALASLDRRPAAGPQVVVEPGPYDDCAGALAAGAGTFAGRLGGAESAASAEVWFRYTAPRAGLVTASTVGSDLDTELTVYAGCPSTKSSEVASNDEAVGLQAAVSFAVAKAEERMIRLRGVGGAEGLFVLQLGFGGGIAGTVTNAQGGAPLANVEVDLWNSQGFYSGSGISGGNGSYIVGELDPGTYFATTFNDLGFIDELYNDIPCPGGPFSGGCSPVSGTPILVQAGTTTGGINFGLRLGGTISGRVRQAVSGLAIPSAGVDIYRPSGLRVAQGWTDAAGRFRISGLTAGTYFAQASSFLYEGELFREIACPMNLCDATTGTPISVSLGTTTSAVDFTLDRLGSIAGTITDAVSGEPIPGGLFVNIYNSFGITVAFGSPSASGYYEVGGLPAGTYFASAFNFSDYIDELYDDIPCPVECDVTSGTPIVVNLNATTSGVDFGLELGGRITGKLTDASSGDPIPFPNVVEVWDAGGTLETTGNVDFEGNYIVVGLFSGSHFVTTATFVYVDELYDDIPCLGGPPEGCDPTTGTPIPTSVGSTTSGIDFALVPLGKISGTVVDSMTGLPLSFTGVNVWNAGGSFVNSGGTNASGTYTVYALPTGTYFVTTDSFDHVDELYDDLPCSTGCLPTVGTPIPVTVGTETTGVDFALERRGAIAGTVTHTVTGLPLVGVTINVFDVNGSFESSADSDLLGKYSIPFLIPGSHFAVTFNFDGYFDELYDNLPCPSGSCTPTTGTPILVSTGATTMGIEFALALGPGISGKVTASNGAPLPGVAIDIWTTAGQYWDSTATDVAGRYGIPLFPGTFFVSTDNGLGGIDEIYDNVPCPLGPAHDGLCDPTTGTPVPVIDGMPGVTGIDFVLSGIPIFRDGFESGNTGGWSPTVP